MGTVGVVGLGVMGSAIAERLATTLGTLHVHDLRPEARAALAAQGAVPHADLGSLAAACDVVILSLNTADVVRTVALGDGSDGSEGSEGPGGGLAGAGRPLLVVDMSSISPVATRVLAEQAAARGLAWVDAPLSGGAPGARAGRLTLMVGGAEHDVTRARRAALDHLAARVTHLGPAGAGQLVKLVNQVLVGAAFGALAEAAALIRAQGLDAATVLDALTGGRADSAVLQEFFVKFATADLTPTGRVANMVKDLDGACEHARSLGLPLPLTTQVVELNRWLTARGLGDADNAALMGYYDSSILGGLA